MSGEYYSLKAQAEDAKRYLRHVLWEATPKIRPAISATCIAAAVSVPSPSLKLVFGAVATVAAVSAAKDYFVRDQWGMSGFSWTKIAWEGRRSTEAALKEAREAQSASKPPSP